jgi:hypothetical protein
VTRRRSMPCSRRSRQSGDGSTFSSTAVAGVKRYFEGEETDFSGFRLDLGGQNPFFEQIYAVGRMGPNNDLWHSGEGTRRRARGGARCWSSDGQKIRSRCLFPATGSWRPAVRLAVFPRRAAPRPRSACSRYRALISSRRDRLSNLWGSEMCALRHSRSDEPLRLPDAVTHQKKQGDTPCRLLTRRTPRGTA